jgi:hypothetical protein
MVAEHLVEAWNRITPDITDSAWCIYRSEWEEDYDRDEVETKDGDYQQVISVGT